MGGNLPRLVLIVIVIAAIWIGILFFGALVFSSRPTNRGDDRSDEQGGSRRWLGATLFPIVSLSGRPRSRR